MTEASLEQIYTAYSGKIRAYFASHLNSRADVEDLCSDVFEKVARSYDAYDKSKSSISTWIYTIARNRLIDFYRTSHPSDELPENLPQTEEIDDGLLQEESLNNLAAALRQLNQEERDIIVLRYYKGKPLTEIAEMLHLSYGAVKLRHQKALGLLRQYLSEE